MRIVPAPAASTPALEAVRQALARVPKPTAGYGLLRYLGDAEERARLSAAPSPEVLFNYLGQLDRLVPDGSPLLPVDEDPGPLRSPRQERSHRLEVVARVHRGRLGVTWRFSGGDLDRRRVEDLAAAFEESVRERRVPAFLGPSEIDLTQEQLQSVLAEIELE